MQSGRRVRPHPCRHPGELLLLLVPREPPVFIPRPPVHPLHQAAPFPREGVQGHVHAQLGPHQPRACGVPSLTPSSSPPRPLAFRGHVYFSFPYFSFLLFLRVKKGEGRAWGRHCILIETGFYLYSLSLCPTIKSHRLYVLRSHHLISSPPNFHSLC